VIQCPDLRETRSSFKLLMRAVAPSSTVVDPQDSFLKAFEASEWLVHLSSIMQLAGAVMDLIDIQGSSVMLCLGDGADVNTQVTITNQIKNIDLRFCLFLVDLACVIYSFFNPA
jgi:myotubularin-related protein 5/13